jgi:two-component system response regulator AtoC
MGIKIQIVDSKDTDHRALFDFFKGNKYQMFLSNTVKKALRNIKKEKPDLVFLALDLPDLNGVEVLKKIKKNGESIAVFSIVSSVEKGIEAMKLGSEHYFLKPYNLEEVKIVLERCLALKHYKERIEESRLQYLDRLEKSEMLVVSKTMKETYQSVMRVAENGDAPLLVTGEVGCGKKLLAKIIHLRSGQFMFPFVSMNCRDKSACSLDTQLLGVAKETVDYKRIIEKPHILEGGTLFLYNIEHLTKADQLKVLKFLKSRKLGKGKKKSSSAIGRRIIAATSMDLKVLVNKGKFNKELYQKISRCSAHIPPLRKRPKEIIPLAMHFVKSFNQEYGKNVVKIDDEVKNHLEFYDWPGNVSELKNIIEHAVVLSQSENISVRELGGKFNKKLMSLDTLLMNGSFLSLEEMVSLYVSTVIKKVKGNKSKAAKVLKVSRNTLKKKSIAF